MLPNNALLSVLLEFQVATLGSKPPSRAVAYPDNHTNARGSLYIEIELFGKP